MFLVCSHGGVMKMEEFVYDQLVLIVKPLLDDLIDE